MHSSGIQHALLHFLLTSLAGSGCPTVPRTGQDAQQRSQEYLDCLVAQDRLPGLQYFIVNQNGNLLEYHGGWANIQQRVPMTPQTTMMAYSATKPITAAAVLKLVNAGLLDLDQHLTHYLPDLPYPGVSVRDVLSHTAGIPNPIIGNLYVHKVSEHDRFHAQALLAETLAEHGSLDFKPGTRVAYTNLGYILLGLLIEKAAGKSYTSFIREEVFQPLGITEEEMNFVIPDPAQHARGYLARYSVFNLILAQGIKHYTQSWHGRWKTLDENWYFNFPAQGGIIGTAKGFAKFLHDQLQPESRLFSRELKEQFYTVQSERTPAGSWANGVTLGWFLKQQDQTRHFYHQGGGFGFVSEMRMYPDQGLASILMINRTCFAHKSLLNRIDPLFR